MAKKETSRTIRARATKKHIFKTSIRLFAENGFDKVTIAEICNTAGVSKGLFYNYFKSKEALFVEHFRIANEKQLRIRQFFTPGETFTERFEVFVKAVTQFNERFFLEATRVAYVYALENPGKTMLASKERDYHHIIHEILEYGRQRGEIRTDIGLEEMAHVIVAHLWGCCFSYLIGFEQGKSLSDIEQREMKLIRDWLTAPVRQGDTCEHS